MPFDGQQPVAAGRLANTSLGRRLGLIPLPFGAAAESEFVLGGFSSQAHPGFLKTNNASPAQILSFLVFTEGLVLS